MANEWTKMQCNFVLVNDDKYGQYRNKSELKEGKLFLKNSMVKIWYNWLSKHNVEVKLKINEFNGVDQSRVKVM